jgi:DNA-binding transcriptional LysR family regulator
MQRGSLDDLVAFVAVARQRSFTKAAAKLGISQSALSQTIRQLEARLPDATGALIDVSVSSRLCFDDLEAIADAAAVGMGLAWLPSWLIRDRVSAGDVVGLWGDRPSATMGCYAVWPATHSRLEASGSLEC